MYVCDTPPQAFNYKTPSLRDKRTACEILGAELIEIPIDKDTGRGGRNRHYIIIPRIARGASFLPAPGRSSALSLSHFGPALRGERYSHKWFFRDTVRTATSRWM